MRLDDICMRSARSGENVEICTCEAGISVI